ncbi:hypothetical protein QQG74_05990 [Micromonospora sp. FIMYZ51]|uniref:hypothetical protein n=1 Tax=Micromonospora sp. FIMYZ51 TaxID=3051832 RepID=UPI00311DEB08
MRARAEHLVPDPVGVLKDRRAFFRVLKDRRAFFRTGRSGQGNALLDDATRARHRTRVAALAQPDLLAWLHRDR